MKTITNEEYTKTDKLRNTGKYNFGLIEIGSPVEYSEKDTGKSTRYLSKLIHGHGDKNGKKFKTHKVNRDGVNYLRVMRLA